MFRHKKSVFEHYKGQPRPKGETEERMKETYVKSKALKAKKK